MRRLLLLSALFLSLASPFTAVGQAPPAQPPAQQQEQPALIPLGGDIPGAVDCNLVTGKIGFRCIPLYIAYLIQLVFGLIGGFCLIQIIWAGYQIAFGGLSELGFGDKEAGKKRLQAALIGLAACILSFVIVDMIVSALVLGP